MIPWFFANLLSGSGWLILISQSWDFTLLPLCGEVSRASTFKKYLWSLFLFHAPHVPLLDLEHREEMSAACCKKDFPKKCWILKFYLFVKFSVQFSRLAVSDSLWPRGLQHTRPPCPSPTPRACSNSRPSSRWCHPTISSSVIPFSSCLQSFPESGSLPMSQFFASDGQNIGVSALASVFPMNIQDWFPLELTQILLICKVNQRYHTLLYFISYFRATLWICPFFLPEKEPLFLVVTSWLKFFFSCL